METLPVWKVLLMLSSSSSSSSSSFPQKEVVIAGDFLGAFPPVETLAVWRVNFLAGFFFGLSSSVNSASSSLSSNDFFFAGLLTLPNVALSNFPEIAAGAVLPKLNRLVFRGIIGTVRAAGWGVVA